MYYIYIQLNFELWPTILHVYICVTQEGGGGSSRSKQVKRYKVDYLLSCLNLLFDHYCNLRFVISLVCLYICSHTLLYKYDATNLVVLTDMTCSLPLRQRSQLDMF